MPSSRAAVAGSSPASLFIQAMPALFVVLWSTGFVVAKLGLPYAPPLTFLSLRYTCVIALLLPIVWWVKAPWPAPVRGTGHIAVAGVLVHAGYLAGIWCAITLGMSAGLAALIAGLQPVLTALAGPWLGERVNAKQWLGFGLGVVGVALVVADSITFTGVSVASVGLCVMALLSITGGTLYQKRFCPRFDLRTGALVQFAASLLMTLPFALALEVQHIEWSPAFVFALGWSVFALSLGAISLLFVLIRRGAATRVVSLFYLTPPTTAIMAWFMFGESLSLLAMAGMVVAVLGVALVIRKSPPTPIVEPS
jgi:drug/metabolite transporter (DMT)-like permease